MPQLVRPSIEYQQSFLAAVREAQETQSGLGDTLKWDLEEITADFDRLLADLRKYEPGNTLPDGFVYSEYWWLVKDDQYLGRVSIRHSLNQMLREFGGHIGYEVRPSARRQGHATELLRLALPIARERGLERVLVTCDVSNVPSARVIEANGGISEGEFDVPEFHDQRIRRYWIRLHPSS